MTLNGGVPMSFQLIPAGAFRMGSRGQHSNEEPQHLVRMTRPFYLGTVPVTQEQFGVWTRDHTPPGGVHENHFKGRTGHPAENLSWDDALAFCAWLNEAYGAMLLGGLVATLPTEAEWEYACRAGTETEYHTGDGHAALRDAAWFDENFETGATHAVRLKAANGFGLHDVHGNVWEWCWDVYDADAYRTRVDGVADPGSDERETLLHGGAAARASSEGNPDRVIRGGSWFGSAGFCRSASRLGWGPGNRFGDRGFRVCLVPRPVPERSAERGASVGGARPAYAQGFGAASRDAEAESEGAGAPASGVDLSRASFRRRRKAQRRA